MLTEDQIQYLYKFCVKHYVRYYDLQVELVDHLAKAIEEKMLADNNLSFETALNEVYKAFGVMGFSNVISEKQNGLAKSYQKSFWQNFKSYFSVPKVAVTILIFLLLNVPVFVFKFHDPELLYMIYSLTVAIAAIIASIYFSVKFKKPKKQLLLFQNRGIFLGPLGLLLQIPNFYYNIIRGFFEPNTNPQSLVNIIMTAFCVAMTIFCFAAYESYKKLYEEARKDYPIAFA